MRLFTKTLSSPLFPIPFSSFITCIIFLCLGTLSTMISTTSSAEPLPSDIFIRLAEKVNPAVVNISTSSQPKIRRRRVPHQFNRDPFFDMLEEFLNPHGLPQQQRPKQSLGTGFIIRKDGLIITNNHVIDKADVINVALSNSKEVYTAEVIGKDQRTDTALIKIKAKKNLPFVLLGDSDKLKVGEWVAAFGNPFGHSNSMSKGIISALGRKIGQLNRFPFLQTDASINPGNSGGPLVNMKGEVIGVNTAIDPRAQGIGFAIPINDIKSILSILEKEGGIRRGFLGVNLGNIHPEAINSLGLKDGKGALVINVIKNSPASKAGLKEYDFITQVDGKNINSAQELVDSIAGAGVSRAIKLGIIRQGQKKTIKVSLATHPDDKKLKKSQLTKSYSGQKAPFDLGFRIADYKKAKKDFELPSLKREHPVVIEVEPRSPAQIAGLVPGDMILDINFKPVYKAKDVIKRLKKGNTNVLRVLRGQSVALIYLGK